MFRLNYSYTKKSLHNNPLNKIYLVPFKPINDDPIMKQKLEISYFSNDFLYLQFYTFLNVVHAFNKSDDESRRVKNLCDLERINYHLSFDSSKILGNLFFQTTVYQ